MAKDKTIANRCSVMQPFMKNINYSCMTVAQLANIRGNCNYLTDDELMQVYHFMGDKTLTQPFSTKVRSQTK